MSAFDPLVTSSPSSCPPQDSVAEPLNLRKRIRTACTRCKNRKQKCDETLPVCSNCLRAGADCDKADVAKQAPPPIAYTRALEERVAQLEILLNQGKTNNEQCLPQSKINESPTASIPDPPASDKGEHENNMSTLNEVVGIISLGNFEAPAYVGPSAGLSLAVNLGEMVQATVWKKAIPDHPRGPPSPTASERRTPLNGVRAMTMDELIKYSMKEPPSDELGSRLVRVYLQQLHPRYPFLDADELWKLQKARTPVALSKSGSLSTAQRYGVFKLYMVFAIAATLLRLTTKSTETSVSPERFYMTALQHMAAAKVPRTIQNIEAMTLLVVYHLRSASGMALWYMIGLAMRTCIDLGMHQKYHEQGMGPTDIDKHRRLFWTVYSLERVIAISLGRPLSIPDRQIDVDFPDTRGIPSPPNSAIPRYNTDISITNGNLELTNLLFQLRRIEARIHTSIYRTDKPLRSIRPKLEKIYRELDAWRLSLTGALPFEKHALDYPLLLYHRAVRMLIQPFLAILPVSDPYYSLCLSAAGNICQMQKRLHQTVGYGHSFIAVQTIFVAGVTLLYGLWTQTHLVWSVTLANDLRACSLVLFVMSERAPWVRKYRDAFEFLADAAMEKLRSGESSLAEMVNVAQTQTQRGTYDTSHVENVAGMDSMGGSTLHSGPESAFSGNNALGEDADNVWRLVSELANWIDQDQDATPVWMPNFEAMQNISSNEPF